VDLIRKDRIDTESKLRDVHIKNITVDFFALPLTGAALALVFKLTHDMEQDEVKEGVRDKATCYRMISCNASHNVFTACIHFLLQGMYYNV
jgi:hypothetical protein